MVDYSTQSILTKCASLNDSYLPIYEAYLGQLQDDQARIVYFSNNIDRRFVTMLSKIFTDEEFSLIICSEETYKSGDSRAITHHVDYTTPTSSLMGKINAYGPIDCVINDADIPYTDQVSVLKTFFRYLTPGGLYMIKNSTDQEGLKKLVEYTKMLKKSVMEIEYIRSYNSGQFTVVKKSK